MASDSFDSHCEPSAAPDMKQQGPIVAERSQISKLGPRHELGGGSILSFKRICYSVYVKGQASDSSYDLQQAAGSTRFVEIGSHTRSKRVPRALLNDVTGFAKASELTAIIGSSGSGKTTLLDTLAHRIAAANSPDVAPGTAGAGRTGKITLDDVPVTSDLMRRISAYVMQDDLMHATLTVRETLMFSAEMNLPSRTFSRADKEEKVDRLLDLLGLRHVANSLIGDENFR